MENYETKDKLFAARKRYKEKKCMVRKVAQIACSIRILTNTACLFMYTASRTVSVFENKLIKEI